jgi:DNA polymerase I
MTQYRTLSDTYFKHVLPLSKALSAAQERGVLIDIKARNELKEKYEKEIIKTQSEINDIAEEKVNCNSPKQMTALLYEKLRYPSVYEKGSNGENKLSTSETAILSLKKKFPNDTLLSLILKYRKDTKLVSTFLSVPTDENNRMHTSYNVSGTKTYRISSSKDLFGNGMNLQNIPAGKKPGVENVRHIFIASPGHKLIKSDLSQAETLVVARILCRYKDYTLYEKYKDKSFDIHRWAASAIYNKREEDMTKEERDVGKIANHSGNYCSGPMVIVNTSLKWGIDDMDYQTAKIISDTRHKQLPGLRQWWQDVENKIASTRTLYTCMGRRRIFFGRTSDNTVVRDAVSFEPQSTVGDVCNEIFRKMYELRDLYKGLPVLQVHDEVVIECPDDKVDVCIDLLKVCANIPLLLNKDLPPLIIPLEIKVGDNWRDTKLVE